MTSWTIAAFTHRGHVRPDNEDAIAIGNRIFTFDMDAPVVMTAPNGCCLLMIADGGVATRMARWPAEPFSIIWLQLSIGFQILPPAPK
jgi:hypothetical protein